LELGEDGSEASTRRRAREDGTAEAAAAAALWRTKNGCKERGRRETTKHQPSAEQLWRGIKANREWTAHLDIVGGSEGSVAGGSGHGWCADLRERNGTLAD
jgi:hypothetical protein